MFSAGNRVSRQVLESIITNLKVLESPVSERDEQRIAAAAAACAELSFLRLLEPEELVDTCRQHLRVERLRAGEAVHLQGMEATAAFVVLSGQVSCHARKDLMDIEGGAHMHLLREWKQRELSTAKEEAVKAKARFAYISSSANAGSAAEAAAKHEAAVAEQAVEVAAEAVANVMLSGLVPPDKYMMLPDMMGKQRAPAATPTPSAPRKFGLRQQLMRATMDLGLTSDLSPSEVRSKASKLVGVCLTVHNTGDSFGEPTLDSSNRRAITAVCNTACTLLVCPRHVLAATAGAERLKQQLEWLRNVPALAMCSPPTLAQLLQAARRRTFAWSEPVMRAGDKGACLYLVMSGELSLSRATSRPPAPDMTRPPTPDMTRPPAPAPHTPAPPVPYSPVPRQSGIRPASPPPTTPAYFLAGAADPAKRAADAAGSPKPAAAGVGDSNTPREMTLRTIGSGQMVPCIVAGAASLGGAVTLAEGVRFPYTARVASAHAELLLLDGRFLSLLLARQDNGRAIGELTALLQSDARRMEQLAQATEDRWLTELVTAKILVAPTTPTPPSKPSLARTPGASSPRIVSRPATGQRQPPHVLPGPEGPPRVPPPPDPGVIAPSKYSDPSMPGPLPLPPYFEPSTRRDDEDVAAALVASGGSDGVGEVMGARAADVQALERAMELERLGERARARALRAPKPPPRATSQMAEALEPPAGRLLPDPEAALVVEVARMEAEALEQAHELQAMFTPRPLRVGVTPKPDFTAITKKHPTGAAPSERQRAVTAYLLEANTLHNPLQSEQAVAAANSAAAATGSRPNPASLPPRPRQRGARPVSAVPAYRHERGAQLGAYWTGDTRPPSTRAFGAVGAGWAAGAARPHFERPHSAQPRVAHRRQGTALSPRQQQQHAQVYLHQPPPPIHVGYGYEQYPFGFETPHHSPHSPTFSVHIGEDTAAGAHGGASSDEIHADGVASTDANLAAAAPPPKASQQPAEAPPQPARARRGYANAVEAHVRRMRASRGDPKGGGSQALPAEDGYRAPLAVHLLNDDGFLRMQVEEYRMRHAGLAGQSDEAVALAWDHMAVAEMARVLSGSWQPHKRPLLISTSIHAVEAPPVPHHRRQPHARMGAAPSHAVHDAVATARRVGAQADNGPLVLQNDYASSRALPTGDASSTGGVRPPRLAATMAPQPTLYGRPVQVDGPGIATALAGTGLRRAPLA